MPAITVPKDNIQFGPGFLFRAPIGSTLPANTVVGSVFTDAWPAAWIPWGVTREGHAFSYQLSTSEVTVAEYLTPLAIVEDSVAIGVDFDVAQVTAKNFAAALNNLASGTSTVSGTGATTLTKLAPPAVGSSVRTMLGWESNDSTERWIWYQCLQSGNLQVQRRKGSNNASLPVGYKVEQPASGDPFNAWYAGTVRVGN